MKEEKKTKKPPHPPKEIKRWCYCKECEDYWRKEAEKFSED